MSKVGRIVVLMVASLGLAGAGACGSSGGGKGPGSTLTADTYNAALANAICAYYVACGYVPNVGICTSTIIPTFLDATLIAEVASGKVHFDATAGQACIDDQATIDCEGTRSAEITTANADCAKVFTGTTANGMACFFGQECASGFCMVPATCATTTCCAGTCAAVPAGAVEGADCSTNSGKCADNNACVYSPIDGSQTCRATVATGEPCVGNGQCREGNNCQYTQVGNAFAGKCGAPVADGGHCDANSFNECLATSYCEGSTTTCTPLVAPGGACNAQIANCVYYANCINALCVQSGDLGATCDPSLNSFDCGGLLLCDSTTMKCVLPLDPVCTSM